ncbi:23355_t:CDS:10, partial [Cetraspora pellucida]
MNHTQQDDIDARSIYVGNLDRDITVQHLRDHFDSCGTIKQITIIFRIFMQMSHAFIEFSDESEVNIALCKNGTAIDGYIIHVATKWINTRTIYVSNVGILHDNVTEDELRNLFQHYGIIHHIRIFNGYAFISFTTSASVDDALRENGTLLGGRNIKINQNMSPDDLQFHFQSCGGIKCVFIRDKNGDRRYAIINFVKRFSINKALRKNNTLLRGTQTRIQDQMIIKVVKVIIRSVPSAGLPPNQYIVENQLTFSGQTHELVKVKDIVLVSQLANSVLVKVQVDKYGVAQQ